MAVSLCSLAGKHNQAHTTDPRRRQQAQGARKVGAGLHRFAVVQRNILDPLKASLMQGRVGGIDRRVCVTTCSDSRHHRCHRGVQFWRCGAGVRGQTRVA